MKPSPFLPMLREAVKHSASGDDLAQRLYHEGDRENLRRWLAHAGAAEIFDKLHNGKCSPKRAITLIMTVLRVRELAELCNGLNATFAALEQRQLANDEVSPEALKRRSAKQTIFCRILSDIFHSNFDRWHDTEVAALCEIAFDCKDIISTDAVKTARRGLKKR